MKRWLLSVALLLAGIACIAHAQVPMTGAGKGAPGGGGSPPSIDCGGSSCGAATNSTGTISATLKTTNTNDVIVVFLAMNGNTSLCPFFSASNIADTASLSWTMRTCVAPQSGAFPIVEFYAIATSALSSDTITVTQSNGSPSYSAMAAFGISGANTSTPFDASSSSTGIDPVSYTSTHPNTIFIAGNRANASTPTAGTCCTVITNEASSFMLSEYVQEPTATTVSMNVGTGSGGSGMIADAIKH